MGWKICRSHPQSHSAVKNSPRDPQLIKRMASDSQLAESARNFFLRSWEFRYSYNFTWLGRPVIQYPQDLMALQEIIWDVKPDAIVETGVAHGGGTLFLASMLELLGGDGFVVAVEVDLRAENRAVLEAHPLARRIRLIDGSSVDESTAAKVFAATRDRKRLMVALDANHTHDHVLRELELYSPLVRQGSYIVVFDTIVGYMPSDAFADRPWGPDDNPLTAVREFLARNPRFEVDEQLENTLLITVAPGGYLRCIKDL